MRLLCALCRLLIGLLLGHFLILPVLHRRHSRFVSLFVELGVQFGNILRPLTLHLRLCLNLGHSQLDQPILVCLGHIKLVLKCLFLRFALHLNDLALTLKHQLLQCGLHLTHLLVHLLSLLLHLPQLLEHFFV